VDREDSKEKADVTMDVAGVSESTAADVATASWSDCWKGDGFSALTTILYI
jgi:hypothetical protein